MHYSPCMVPSDFSEVEDARAGDLETFGFATRAFFCWPTQLSSKNRIMINLITAQQNQPFREP